MFKDAHSTHVKNCATPTRGVDHGKMAVDDRGVVWLDHYTVHGVQLL